MRAALVLVALLLLAMPLSSGWGNGSSSNAEFRYYGVHDAIAQVAWEKLRAHDPAGAAWLTRWFLPEPGGYGASFDPWALGPGGADNLLGWTDDPDSAFQDWCNHLYMVHPRGDAPERCAPQRVADLVGQARENLTLSRLAGEVPCNPFEHRAAYDAGLLAHYVGDLSQFGHTDDTRRDHRHPRDDPSGRTYHGYYESQAWGSRGLRALLADQRARPWSPDLVEDPSAAAVALAVRVNMPDGATVRYRDADGRTVDVGSGYAAMLDAYVAAYDGGQAHLGMRGYTPALWAATMANVAGAVDLLADLWWTVANVPLPANPLSPAACLVAS